MDRPIHQDEQRRRQLGRAARALAVVATLVAVLFGVRAALKPSLAAEDLLMAQVVAGPMVAAIDFSGRILPRSETVLSAPFASEIRQVSAPPGTALAPGDAILSLEFRPLDAELAQLREQMALKDNERRGRALTLDQSMNSARGERALKAIDLESHRARLDRLEQLAGIGAISKGELLEARLDVRRSVVALERIDGDITHLAAAHQAELERIDLEASILESQLAEKERLRELAVVRAPHAGVVTWVQEDLGTSVPLGAALARVADLSHFRVEATASDYYADSIGAGQRARVRIANRTLGGTVASVLPAVEAGTLRVLLALDDPAAPGLRPNLRADIQLAVDRAEHTLSVERGPGFQGRGDTPVFRIDGDRAVRVTARLGFSNRDRVQVLEGLAAGDRVIISATDRFRHLDAIALDR